jgi:hypothetical protein
MHPGIKSRLLHAVSLTRFVIIETILAENNEKYSRFPNDHIHCQMSLDVYRENFMFLQNILTSFP